MTLYDLWINEHGADLHRAIELLPHRAMPLPITDRIRQMIAQGQPLNQYHREKLENALKKYPATTSQQTPIIPPSGGEGVLAAGTTNPVGEQGTIAFIDPVPGERSGPGDQLTPSGDGAQTPPSGGWGAIPKDHELYPITRPLLKEHGHYHALMVEEGLKDIPDKKRLAELAGKVLTISGKIDAAYNKYRKENT